MNFITIVDSEKLFIRRHYNYATRLISHVNVTFQIGSYLIVLFVRKLDLRVLLLQPLVQTKRPTWMLVKGLVCCSGLSPIKSMDFLTHSSHYS